MMEKFLLNTPIHKSAQCVKHCPYCLCAMLPRMIFHFSFFCIAAVLKKKNSILFISDMFDGKKV